MRSNLRPVFRSFKLLSADVKNKEIEGRLSNQIELVVKREVEVVAALPKVKNIPVLAMVHVRFDAEAKIANSIDVVSTFKAEYQAVFKFEENASAKVVQNALEEDDELQYSLSVQAVPLALENFKSILRSSGFDTRKIGFGV